MRLVLHLLLMGVAVSAAARPRIVVVTATAGFRHDSIATAEQVLATTVDADIVWARTADDVRTYLNAEELGGFDAVFFVNTTGELPHASADALLAWIRGGGTFVGFHSAADTWHGVPEYIEMIGAEFIAHPPETAASVFVDDNDHVATSALTSPHLLYEEFYYFQHVDLTKLRPLLSLRNRPEPPADPGYWPLSWEKTHGAGRVLYTALGHRDDVWTSEWFQTHLAGIVTWALTPAPSRPKLRAVRH